MGDAADWVRSDCVPQRNHPRANLNCSELREMSNMIALVSLDFGGAGSMCGVSKGVDADGRTFG